MTEPGPWGPNDPLTTRTCTAFCPGPEAGQSFIKPLLDVLSSPHPDFAAPHHRLPSPEGLGWRRPWAEEAPSSGVMWYWPLPSRESAGREKPYAKPLVEGRLVGWGTGVWPSLKSKDQVTEVVGCAPPSRQTDRGPGGCERWGPRRAGRPGWRARKVERVSADACQCDPWRDNRVDGRQAGHVFG